MLNKRRKRKKLPDYAVRFIGYSASIVARRENAECASLDFVSGAAGLCTNEGFLFVTKRAALSSAVAELPSCVDELKSLVKSALPSDGRQVELRRGEVVVYLNRGADVERFVGQLARRCRAIEPILEQAERVGSEIKRPPYDDYIDESAKTGIYRVVSYGDAFFVDGELTYHPERRTVLIKPTADIRTFEVLQP
jgi:hypothetical protein